MHHHKFYLEAEWENSIDQKNRKRLRKKVMELGTEIVKVCLSRLVRYSWQFHQHQRDVNFVDVRDEL